MYAVQHRSCQLYAGGIFTTAEDFTNPKVVKILREYNIDFDNPQELEDFHAGLYDGYYEEDEDYEEDDDEEKSIGKSVKMEDQYEVAFEVGKQLAQSGADGRIIGNLLSALEENDVEAFNSALSPFRDVRYRMPEDFDFDGATDSWWAGLEDGFEDEGESYRSSSRSSRKESSGVEPLREYDPDVEPAKVFPLNMGWVTDYFYDRKIVASMLKYFGDTMVFDRQKGYVVKTSEEGVFDQYSQYMGDDKEILSWFVNTLKAAKASGYDYVFFVLKQ